jgi:hypothetical protein
MLKNLKLIRSNLSQIPPPAWDPTVKQLMRIYDPRAGVSCREKTLRVVRIIPVNPNIPFEADGISTKLIWGCLRFNKSEGEDRKLLWFMVDP